MSHFRRHWVVRDVDKIVLTQLKNALDTRRMKEILNIFNREYNPENRPIYKELLLRLALDEYRVSR